MAEEPWEFSFLARFWRLHADIIDQSEPYGLIGIETRENLIYFHPEPTWPMHGKPIFFLERKKQCLLHSCKSL